MNMNSAQLERVREHFGYKDWPPAAAGEVKSLSVREAGIAGMQPVRVQEIQAPEFPPITQAIWQRGEDELIRADVYRCGSSAEARDMAVRILGEYQSPEFARIDPPTAGELAFGEPGLSSLLFVRGNLVVQLRNAGGRIVSLADAAAALDRAIK